MNPAKQLQTTFAEGRICIRRYGPDDAPLLFAAVRESVGELSRWLPWCHPDYSMADSSTFVQSRAADWEKGGHYSFAITDEATGEFIGGVGLNFINRVHNLANVGYWVRTSRTGRGFASAATRLVARFGLKELGFTRLEIVVAVENLASQRVAEKAGAKREGVLRNGIRQRDRLHDAVMYSLIPGDVEL